LQFRRNFVFLKVNKRFFEVAMNRRLFLASLLCSACSAPAADIVKVACVGDSITAGVGAGKETYPKKLAGWLGSGYEVRNFGVSGATMLRSGNLPYHKQAHYRTAIDWKPDIVVIKLGTNDSKPGNWKNKADFSADAETLIADFKKANPNVKVFIALPVPAYPGNFGITDKVIREEVLPLLRASAEKTGTPVIDTYAALSDKAAMFPDKVHPNAAGAELIARAVYKGVTGKDAP